MTEWHADNYHRHSSLQQAMAEIALARLTLQGHERILDVGCGDGKVTAAIAARVPRGSVLGVDPSQNMIAFASERFGPQQHPNLAFARGDVRSLPYRHEFDLVVSFNALHWVREQDAALRVIHTALKPGGQTLLRFVGLGPLKSIEDVLEDVRQSPRWSAHFPGFRKPHAHFTPDEYRVLAEHAGFQVIRIGREQYAWDYQTSEAFAGFCRGTFVEWLRLVPESERETFVADTLDRYRAAAANGPEEANTFKFYQLEAVLASAAGP